MIWSRLQPFAFGGILAVALFLAACGNSNPVATDTAAGASSQAASVPAAPAPATTGGFDGARAYQHVAQLVAIGPHSPGTDGIHRAQAYILSQLKSFGCPVEEQDFHASTIIGDVAMKNIIVKIPSQNKHIILYATHYDSKKLDNFVGADDGGSSTGVLLELSRLLCARKNPETIWLAFFDGEEAFGEWSATDGTFGSRELAASMALSGQLPSLRAMILVDMVGPGNLVIKRESSSTPWLTDTIWSTAGRLGYGKNFVSDGEAVEDDHDPFLQRDVPAVDLIDLDVPYWHTTRDTLDKVDPRSLAIVGHVLIESLPEIEKKAL
jgi:glutaminyl-peptide cyclotransferase